MSSTESIELICSRSLWQVPYKIDLCNAYPKPSVIIQEHRLCKLIGNVS